MRTRDLLAASFAVFCSATSAVTAQQRAEIQSTGDRSKDGWTEVSKFYGEQRSELEARLKDAEQQRLKLEEQLKRNEELIAQLTHVRVKIDKQLRAPVADREIVQLFQQQVREEQKDQSEALRLAQLAIQEQNPVLQKASQEISRLRAGQDKRQAVETTVANVQKESLQRWEYKTREVVSTSTLISPIITSMARAGWEYDSQVLLPSNKSSPVFNKSVLVFRKPVEK